MELLKDNVDEEYKEATCYQCEVGGKRIRPALAVLSCQLLGGSLKDVLYPAAALEILHNYTLIIDDIIDHSEFRRDKETVWKKYGKSMAECFAMFYAASIFEGVNKVKNRQRLAELYSRTIKIIVSGEIKDILFERCGREDEKFVVANRYESITKENYFEMVKQKTAVLLKTSCEAGAICANASEDEFEKISSYGFNLGVAFQIQDDLLDIFGDEKKFGKKIGKDIIEKKMGNFVILSALEELSEDDKQKIIDLLCGGEDVTEKEVTEIISKVKKTNAKKVTERTAREYAEIAIGSLEKLPQNEFRDNLHDLANYIVERDK